MSLQKTNNTNNTTLNILPTSHNGPVHPSRQTHWNDPSVFSHLAPFMHGPRLHSLSSTLHNGPVHPSVQSQTKPPLMFLQVAPWLHGLLKHSSVSRIKETNKYMHWFIRILIVAIFDMHISLSFNNLHQIINPLKF